MRRAGPVLVALALLAETALLRLDPSERPLLRLPLHALVAGTGALLATRVRASRWAALLLVLIGASFSLVDLRALSAGSPAAVDDAEVRSSLESEAKRAREAFTALFAEQTSLLAGLPATVLTGAPAREDLFSALDSALAAQGRSGWPALTLYDEDGAALAWSGEPFVLEGSDLRRESGCRPSQFVRSTPLGTRLFTLRCGPRVAGVGVARVAAAEIVLSSLPQPDAWRALVPPLGSSSSESSVEFLEPDEADTALTDFFSAGGDLYWKRGSVGPPELLTALRSGGGDLLGVLTLRPEPPAVLLSRLTRRQAVPRGLLLAIALGASLPLILASARSNAFAPLEGIALVLFLLAVRLAFGPLVPLLPGAERSALLDYRVFALPLPTGLAGNAASALATALTILAIAGTIVPSARRGGRLARAALGAAGLGLLAGLLLLTPEWVTDSTLNLVRAPLLPIEPARIALSWAHAAVVFAATLLLGAAILPPRRGFSPGNLWAAFLAACLVSHLALAREAARVPSALVESTLAPEAALGIDGAKERLVSILGDSALDPRWEILESGREGAVARLAFDAWRASDLGQTGSRSALAVYDTEGRLVSSFAYGLPDTVFRDTSHLRPIAGPGPGAGESTLEEDLLSVLSLRIPLLHGATWVQRAGRPIGRIEILLSTESDNLKFLTLSDPLLATLGAGRQERIFDEYFGGAPLFVAYDPAGVVRFPAAGMAPPLPSALLGAREPVWTTTRSSGTTYRVYLFPTSGGPRAIGYAAPSTIAGIAAMLRRLLALLPLGAGAALIGLWFREPHPWRTLGPAGWGRLIAGSYYRRLLAAVLASSLLPLLLLSAFFRNSIETRTKETVEHSGEQTAATIRRLIEDYLESESGTRLPITRIDSFTLFWVARTVHQDLHVFVGDELLATSRGDREASGLPTFRLGAPVARALLLSHPPQFLSEEPIAGKRSALVFAPLRLAVSPEAVLAVPLVVQERDLTREGEAVSNALLAATVGLGLLLSAIGYYFARRLSVPINELARASARIADGRLDVRVRSRGRDEVGQLVEGFNSMAGALERQREDLRRRKDYIETVLLNVTTGVISTDTSGVVRTANPAASLLLGLPVDLAGRSLFEELSARPALRPILDLWSGAAAGLGGGRPSEAKIQGAGGEVALRTVVLPLAEVEGPAPGRLFLIEDVTDLMRSNRLAAWAEMARRIAHEIKNPLTPIQLSAEHLLRVRADRAGDYDKVLTECVETILAQVRALREISSEFSTYARLPALHREPTDLAALLRSTLAPYRSAPPPRIEIREAIEALPPAMVDARVLKRVFVNLVENAIQAMEKGGLLTVSLHPRNGAGGPGAEIVVADTGEGMTQETTARIFEPYFSTRDAGTGLGLSIARRAVEEHGGTIIAESSPGRGTRLVVFIPLAEDSKLHGAALSPPPAEDARR